MINLSLKPIIFFTLFALLMSIFPSPSFARDQLWDKGRSTGTFLNGSNTGMQMNVMSASAHIVNTGHISGIERIRAWGRLDNVNQIYSAPYYNGINGVQIRLFSDDSRRSSFFISGANPPDSSKSVSIISNIIYDILGYKGIPTNTITAYVNNFTVSGISTTGLGSYDLRKSFSNVSSEASAKMNLPSSIPSTDADGQVSGHTKGSSAEVYFSYDIRTTNNSAFVLWPQARVQYSHVYPGTMAWFSWTNYAGLKHTVN
jgi:hypothetical protein